MFWAGMKKINVYHFPKEAKISKIARNFSNILEKKCKNGDAILYIQVCSQNLSVAHQYLILILKPTSLLRIQFHNVDLNSWIIETPWSKCMSDVPSINPKYSNASGLVN
jgi:hypothetical protein